MGLEREWWLRLLATLTRPRAVFLALRVDDDDDVGARQEPILLITLLAGIMAVLLTPAWRRLYDEAVERGSSIDGLDVALLTFVTGSIYGIVGYFVLGGLLYLGTRAMGSLGNWRTARQVLAFACVPLALAMPFALVIGLAAFGSDIFRRGGSDSGAAGDVYLAFELIFVAWSLGLLLFGVRTTYGWPWRRAAGALALVVALVTLVWVFAPIR